MQAANVRGSPAGIAIALMIMMTVGCGQRPPPGMAWHVAEGPGLRFMYPDSLLVGRFARTPIPPDAAARGFTSPFQNAVVLVRPFDLGNYALDAIPIGDIPAIWLEVSERATAVFRMSRPDTTYRVGERTVSVFPGFPGPYGDEAYYYVVALPDGQHVEIAGHRRNMHDLEGTRFDEVIQVIASTLEQTGN